MTQRLDESQDDIYERFEEVDAENSRLRAQLKRADADAAKLRQELGYIANAKRRDIPDGEDFRAWAQNRAYHAIQPAAALEAPEAAREESE